MFWHLLRVHVEVVDGISWWNLLYWERFDMWLLRVKHHGQKPYSCDICKKQFVAKCNLVNHMWQHKNQRQRPFKCTQCKKVKKIQTRFDTWCFYYNIADRFIPVSTFQFTNDQNVHSCYVTISSLLLIHCFPFAKIIGSCPLFVLFIQALNPFTNRFTNFYVLFLNVYQRCTFWAKPT